MNAAMLTGTAPSNANIDALAASIHDFVTAAQYLALSPLVVMLVVATVFIFFLPKGK